MSRLRAQRAANFDDFTSFIHKLLSAAWGKEWGVFTERFPNGRDPDSVQMPVITYHSKRKRPGIVGKNTQEIKPRFREEYYTNEEGQPEVINVYSQVFEHEVVFDIWADSNGVVDALAERFENFMMTYTGYLMKQGVQQIIFLESSDTADGVKLSDTAASRSIKYLVRLEKHVEVPANTIKEVIGVIGAYNAEQHLATDDPNTIDDESIKF